MRRHTLLLTFLGIIAGTHALANSSVASSTLATAQPIKPVNPITSGRALELVRLVRQDCGSCHGMSLKGGLGKSLLPRDLAETPIEDLTKIILDGIAGTPMPPWRGLLSEPEVLWIATHLKAGLIKRGNQ